MGQRSLERESKDPPPARSLAKGGRTWIKRRVADDLVVTEGLLGGGEYAFGPLDWEKRLALQEEKQSLEQKLAEVSVWETRLAELLSEAEAREARKENV